jgi:hypothetical protein
MALMPATVPLTETASQLLARRRSAHSLPSLPQSPAQLLARAARYGRIPGPLLGLLTQVVTGSLRLPPARALAARGLAFPHGPSKGRKSADD